MRPALLFLTFAPLLVSAPAAGARRDPAEGEYEAARRAYYALKDDAQRRKFRHHWLNVAHRFEAVAKKHPKSGRAPDALFTAAELLAELSRISTLPEDLDAAIADYELIVDRYPRDNLADDAAWALGRIHLDRTGDTERARRIVRRALDELPRGDLRPKLAALESALPAAPTPRATGKRVAARKKTATPPVAAAPPPPTPSTSTPPEANSSPLLDAIARAAREPSAAEPQAAASPPPQAEPSAPRAEEPAPERLRAAVEGASDVTLAEQLGLKVRRVVIDAGHGGHDTGAIGRGGTREKDVTLGLARRVAELLSDQGLEVILTRDDDTFIRLEDRTRIANEAKGDLFISIHCNASPNRSARGVETFSLNVASDRYSIRLAARENAQSEKSLSDLQFILADLATRANTEESVRLAKQVQQSLVSSLSRKWSGVEDHGTKQALFYVLLGARMPAILVETSFLSNAQEERRLASRAYQSDVARAIADGVASFLEERGRVARVQ